MVPSNIDSPIWGMMTSVGMRLTFAVHFHGSGCAAPRGVLRDYKSRARRRWKVSLSKIAVVFSSPYGAIRSNPTGFPGLLFRYAKGCPGLFSSAPSGSGSVPARDACHPLRRRGAPSRLRPEWGGLLCGAGDRCLEEPGAACLRPEKRAVKIPGRENRAGRQEPIAPVRGERRGCGEPKPAG